MKNVSYYSNQDDISFIPLTVEEEKEFFRAFYEDGSLAARDEILKRHLKFAARLALRTAKGLLADDEAISAGNFGLLKALESHCFDPNRGFRFSTYSMTYIRGSVISSLKQNTNLRWNGYRKEGVSCLPGVEAVTGQVCHKRGEWCSIDDREILGQLEEEFEDHAFDAAESAAERTRLVKAILDTLPEAEAEAVRGEFFFEVSFAETARRIGKTREGIRKAYSRGMRKIIAALDAAGVKKESVL